ncbi:hypothetical protein [Amycolatopsis sp. NPDC001319]|uniref:hypothetical protein n=1 Tax=unclassified Amycolatopsis TaxID=2618356 RepID=UPI0036A18035
MSLGIADVFDSLISHAKQLGIFDRVNQHEPTNAPGNGLTAAIWFQTINPAAGASGLAATSVRLEFWVRVYLPALQQPQDGIDIAIVEAVDELMAAYSGDFDLGESVRNIDLLGQFGAPLSAKAGYLNQDGRQFRTVDIVLPVIINDAWEQTA